MRAVNAEAKTFTVRACTVSWRFAWRRRDMPAPRAAFGATDVQVTGFVLSKHLSAELRLYVFS
jgi:hypothetical protein